MNIFIVNSENIALGGLLSLPFFQDLTEAQTLDTLASCNKWTQDSGRCSRKNDIIPHKDPQLKLFITQCLNILIHNLKFLLNTRESDSDYKYSVSSNAMSTLRSKKQSVSFMDPSKWVIPETCNVFMKKEESTKSSPFGKQETFVYMTLLNDNNPYYLQSSGTQATASVNKCVQVAINCDKIKYLPVAIPSALDTVDTISSTTLSIQSYKAAVRHSDVYFFGRKKDGAKSGMGSSGSDTDGKKRSKTPSKKDTATISTAKFTNSSIQANCANTCAWAQTKTQGSSAGTCTLKTVCIKDNEKEPCPSVCAKLGDLSATISHIKIGPIAPCPFHGADPCTGPSCVLATSAENESAPVKVTTVTNPRRGVFELVVRKLTGAPLAKNELMLEWTPPPSRPPCGSPYIAPCNYPPSCRPTKCKVVACRPSPCKPKICKKSCKKPCGPVPCRVICRSPCPNPCKIPSKIPCVILCGTACGTSGGPACKIPRGMPCRTPCQTTCQTLCRIPCLSLCQKPCRKLFRRPCRSPCRSPCRKPSRSVCRASCRSPRRSICRISPCGSTCLSPCEPPICYPCPVPRRCTPFRPLCRSLPCRRIIKPPCRKPCRPSKLCSSPCSPCGPCKPCPPCRPWLPCNKPCKPKRFCSPPSPCAQPCTTPYCGSDLCSATCSNPCLRLCAVGRRKPRRCRSQPRMKSHKKRISPCNNRSQTCPVVRCQSTPGPYFWCCPPTACPVRKCSSVFPYKPVCCKSTCSSCST